MTDREARDQFIRANYRTMRSHEIAEKLGIPRNTVISSARRLGLSTPRGMRHVMKPATAVEIVQRLIPKAEQPKPEPTDSRYRVFKNPNAIFERGRPGETARVVEAVAAKVAPKDRLCSWRQYEGNGRSLPCCEPAKPGHMWCETHQSAAVALKESA